MYFADFFTKISLFFPVILASIYEIPYCFNILSMTIFRGGRVLLLIIRDGGVPPGSPNPDPISDQEKSFSTLFFRPGLWAEIMSSLLRLERK